LFFVARRVTTDQLNSSHYGAPQSERKGSLLQPPSFIYSFIEFDKIANDTQKGVLREMGTQNANCRRKEKIYIEKGREKGRTAERAGEREGKREEIKDQREMEEASASN